MSAVFTSSHLTTSGGTSMPASARSAPMTTSAMSIASSAARRESKSGFPGPAPMIVTFRMESPDTRAA